MALRPCYLPPKFLVDCALEGNRIRQLRHPAITTEAEVIPFTRAKRQGELLMFDGRRVMVFAKRLPNGAESIGEVLITSDGKAVSSADSQSKWVLSPSECLQMCDKGRLEAVTAAVLRSWSDQFRFVEEQALDNGEVAPGLRPPQIGGLHSALGHWKMSDGVATIVMPTGTGKTETMVALTLHQRPTRLRIARRI